MLYILIVAPIIGIICICSIGYFVYKHTKLNKEINATMTTMTTIKSESVMQSSPSEPSAEDIKFEGQNQNEGSKDSDEDLFGTGNIVTNTPRVPEEVRSQKEGRNKDNDTEDTSHSSDNLFKHARITDTTNGTVKSETKPQQIRSKANINCSEDSFEKVKITNVPQIPAIVIEAPTIRDRTSTVQQHVMSTPDNKESIL